MIYTFKCHASADFSMMQADAEQLFQIIGKAPAPEGIFEVAALRPAILALEKAAAQELVHRPQAQLLSTKEPADENLVEAVELHQRIWPLLDMLRRARDEDDGKGTVVVWGV